MVNPDAFDDLLAACKAALKLMGKTAVMPSTAELDVMEQLRAAIAKATQQALLRPPRADTAR